MNKHFEHDSDCCEYLGSDKVYDFYTCADHGPRVFIARFGNEPPEYSCTVESDLQFSSIHSPTKLAYFRFQVREAEKEAEAV